MKKLLSVSILFCLLAFAGSAQISKYSRIKIWTGDAGMRKLSSLGIETDHGNFKKNFWFESDFSEYEISKIAAAGFKYEVVIDDTIEKYDFSVNVRHRDIYDFTNLYIKILTKFPNGESKTEVISLPLSDESGKWLGKCSGDVCFNRIYLMKKLRFQQKGTYKFYINQEMRHDRMKI